ncbi:MAG: PHP domain-containing protein [Sedimentisphaerales bacterium]|nr:PHP domain-containing protein [Sedimentisphaerales bacterium]
MYAPLLTCRSYYSLLNSALPVERLVEQAAKAGYGYVALTDVDTLSGAVDLWRAANKAGIVPILGAEVVWAGRSVILIIEDRIGYRNLCKILTARHMDPSFDLIGHLEAYHEGLACICDRVDLLDRLRQVLPKDHLFVRADLWIQLRPGYRVGLQPLACTRVGYIDQTDLTITRLLQLIGRIATTPIPRLDPDLEPIIPESRWRQRFAGCPGALGAANSLAERCRFDLLDHGLILPRIQVQEGMTAHRQLARLCHIGLAERYRPVNEQVLSRLEYELRTIQAHGFSDYFLVVYQIVSFAKQRQIPVEVRGSAAGSLVSYVLGFTRVCPITNGLYFERFMNPGRTDCPDIDIDLCWRRRDEVIRFCFEHWGLEHVAMVCNIQRYRRRGAMRDVVRALGLTGWKNNGVVGRLIWRLAEGLIGIPRHIGVHCGGMIITPCPVTDLAPVQMAAKGVPIIQYDKDAAEAIGLVKIDLLGNRALSTVDQAVEIIGGHRGTLDIETAADPSDQATAWLLSCGDSLGVFQSESPGMRQLLQGLHVSSERELAIALSLIRPGPASGGMKAEFIERHLYKKPFKYLHPRLEALLADTHGVMLYQEDVMRIAVELIGYTVAEADRFRSEVSKEVCPGRLHAQYLDFVYNRAVQWGIDRCTAERIWDELLRFAAYSYCKAHATVYAHIAWQTAYLKAHYPLAFYCSLFNNHHGMYPMRVYVWDAKRHGISILPPHVNHSEIDWTIEGNAIRAGLRIVRGLNTGVMEAIVQQRPFRDLDDLRSRVRFPRGQLEDLIRLGACDGLGRSRPEMLNQASGFRMGPNERYLFDMGNMETRDYSDFNKIERLRVEVEITGIPFSLHPEQLLRTPHIQASRLVDFMDRNVTVAGIVAAARKARTQDGKVMGFVTLEDSTGLVEVSFFPDRIGLYDKISSYPGPVWITGKVNRHMGSLSIDGLQCGRAA